MIDNRYGNRGSNYDYNNVPLLLLLVLLGNDCGRETHTQTQRERDRQTDRETDRQCRHTYTKNIRATKDPSLHSLHLPPSPHDDYLSK